MTATCPVCDAEVGFPTEAEEGDIVECADCGAELEVVSTNPPKVAECPEEEEDWGE